MIGIGTGVLNILVAEMKGIASAIWIINERNYFVDREIRVELFVTIELILDVNI